jgi:hypothetical protein
MWVVWQEHNRQTFEDLDNSVSKLVECFVNSLFDWSHAWGFTTTSSIGAFIESLSFFHIDHLYFMHTE